MAAISPPVPMAAKRRAGDAVDVAEQLGEGAIVDCGDGGAQDDRAEDVGAVDDGVGEDRVAGEDSMRVRISGSPAG